MASSIPSIFPVIDIESLVLSDGKVVGCNTFCKRAVLERHECKSHYERIKAGPPGYTECPFGFTSRTFDFDGSRLAVTAVVAHPRFGSEKERQQAKKFPQARVSRAAIDEYVAFVDELSKARVRVIEDGAKVLPQALHELRKLSAVVIQYSEKELRDRELKKQDTQGLQTIHSAAELMRNNFDILEALSDIESMRNIPLTDSINLFDLLYKMKKVYEEKARVHRNTLRLDGLVAIVQGSFKSFPIVPAVLIENAIKYSKAGSTIGITIDQSGNDVVLDVENESEFRIDPDRCFEKGARFAGTRFEGGGFGLYLAKQITEAHKGTIYCFPNSGSVCMSVRLPLVKILPGR